VIRVLGGRAFHDAPELAHRSHSRGCRATAIRRRPALGDASPARQPHAERPVEVPLVPETLAVTEGPFTGEHRDAGDLLGRERREDLSPFGSRPGRLAPGPEDQEFSAVTATGSHVRQYSTAFSWG